MKRWVCGVSGVGMAVLGTSAVAAEPFKVAFMNSLTSTSSVGAQQARDGFALATKKLGEKFGGIDTQIQYVDDEGKPDIAVGKVKALVEREQVNAVVGMTFTNVTLAVVKPITQSKTFLISTNSGPSNLSGKGCNPYFFAESYDIDLNMEVSGQYAQEHGLKRVFLLAPNYQAGKDATAGFKAKFKGEIVDEVYTPLGQPDYSAEISKIAAAKPDALFIFLPGGPGVNFVKQFRQAGLAGKMVFLSAFTVDEAALPAQGDDAVGFFSGSDWAPNLDNPTNKAFVHDFEAQYGYVPSNFAAHAYDAAMLIDSAVRAVKGNFADKEAFRAALKKADFKSVRGDFAFGNNQFPIQNYYLVKAAKRPDGKYQTEMVENTLPHAGSELAAQCTMK